MGWVKWVEPAHEHMFPVDRAAPGSVWECDCGVRFELTGGGWFRFPVEPAVRGWCRTLVWAVLMFFIIWFMVEPETRWALAGVLLTTVAGCVWLEWFAPREEKK